MDNNNTFGDAAEGMVMDKAGYTGALAPGKIGGTKRELSIVSLDVRGSRAAVRHQVAPSPTGLPCTSP